MDINIINETPEDYIEVEELTKKAFRNVNVPDRKSTRLNSSHRN